MRNTKRQSDAAKQGNNNFDMHEDELRDFLMNRIAELRSAENESVDELNAGRFKFKASTISNVLPSGHIAEQSRLEANYKNRFKNKGEKLHKKMLNKQQMKHEKINEVIR